jgi:hypothetical protein
MKKFLPIQEIHSLSKNIYLQIMNFDLKEEKSYSSNKLTQFDNF